MFGEKSIMWKELSQGKTVSPDFLNPSKAAAIGIGMSVTDEAEYTKQFESWVERYKHHVSPQDLDLYPEPAAGQPLIINHLGYKASVPYIKNLSLAKIVFELENRRNLRILEIGAGYGGMAEILTRMLTPASYTIIDLPEMLQLSTYYLREIHPDANYDFRKPENIDSLDKFDLILNFSSFGEMPAKTAQAYVSFAMNHLATDGMLISHNSVKRTPDGVKKASEFGFQNYHIAKILPAKTIGGALYDQHLILCVKNGLPNITADRLNQLQSFAGLGLQEEISSSKDDAMLIMYKAVRSPFFRNRYLREYLKIGKSKLARAFAQFLLGEEIEAPEYLKSQIIKAGKRGVLRKLKAAI